MRTAQICPTCATYTNAVCVIYDGEYLSNINASPGDDLQTILASIDSTVSGLQVALGYVPEDEANKVTSLASPDNTTYPTSQLLKDQLDLKQNVLTGYTGNITVGLQTLTFTNGVLTSVV